MVVNPISLLFHLQGILQSNKLYSNQVVYKLRVTTVHTSYTIKVLSILARASILDFS